MNSTFQGLCLLVTHGDLFIFFENTDFISLKTIEELHNNVCYTTMWTGAVQKKILGAPVGGRLHKQQGRFAHTLAVDLFR